MKEAKLLVSILMVSLLVGCSSTSSSINEGSSQYTSSESSVKVNETYENPVWEPILADPSIIRDENGVWYAFGTQDSADWGSQGYGQKIGPILESYDLVNWDCVGSVFKMVNSPTWSDSIGAGLWAPDIQYVNGQYVLYYSLSIWGDPNPGIGVATAPHPKGPWVDQGKLFNSNEIGVPNSIDASVFVDDDGRVYMMWGSFCGIYGIELSSDGLSIKENATKKLIAGYETNVWSGDQYEGAYLRKINGYYYLFLSLGTCCDGFNSTYHVRVARSTEPLGEYVQDDGKPLKGFGNRGTLVLDKSSRFVGVGHNSLTQDDAGNWWIVYHGYDTKKEPNLGTTSRRSLLIDKLLWTEDGWPYVENYIASTTSDVPVVIKNNIGGK